MKASDLTPWRGPSELRDSRAGRDAANADHATVTDHRGFHAPDNGRVMRKLLYTTEKKALPYTTICTICI